MIKKLILFFLFFPAALFAQHYIKGTFSPASDYKFVILYHITPKGALYTAEGPIAQDGTFKLKLDAKVAQGAYTLTYGIPQEKFNFDIIYNGKEDVDLTFNEKDGLRFTSPGQNKLLADYLLAMEGVQEEINVELNSKKPNSEAIKRLLKEQSQIQNNAENNAEGTFVSTFIKANRPFIPDNFNNRETYLKKRKDTYFENFDFNNVQLQRSNFPINKIKNYYEEFGSKKDSTIFKAAIDCIDEKLKPTDGDFHKSLLTDFWSYLIADNQTDAANYLAETYLIPLAKKLGDNKLAEQLSKFKNISIGSKAPDFSWTETKNGTKKTQTLYGEQGAKNYIVVFWSAECSHCDKEIPVLYKKIASLPEGEVKVVAIGLEDRPGLWKQKILNYPKFDNVLGLKKWDNEIAAKYGVMATPTYFVLDKDKKIIAKPVELEDVFKEIDSLEK